MSEHIYTYGVEEEFFLSQADESIKLLKDVMNVFKS